MPETAQYAQVLDGRPDGRVGMQAGKLRKLNSCQPASQICRLFLWHRYQYDAEGLPDRFAFETLESTTLIKTSWLGWIVHCGMLVSRCFGASELFDDMQQGLVSLSTTSPMGLCKGSLQTPLRKKFVQFQVVG